MARPRVINPNGEVRRIGVSVSEPVVQRLEREARKRGVTLSEVIRERLAS
jgi:hypothetical protein